ncbi:Sorting nexin-13 [Smittium culicis]|uniref:Sorting nexin-13 n=1 Tax=Smittium culicis TaxID=133412 RepID=A0A1R1WZP7_9FUNG|nr:Sorting nexin-13 [Smittium culicis]
MIPAIIVALLLILLCVNLFLYYREFSFPWYPNKTKLQRFSSKQRMAGNPQYIPGFLGFYQLVFGNSQIRPFPKLKFIEKTDFDPSNSSYPSKYSKKSEKSNNGLNFKSNKAKKQNVVDFDIFDLKTPGSAELNSALLDFVKLIMKDFIQSWYSHISADPNFQSLLQDEICFTLKAINMRIQNFDLEKFMAKNVISRLSEHLYKYRKAERISSSLLQKNKKAKDNNILNSALNVENGDYNYNILTNVDELKEITNIVFRKISFHPSLKYKNENNCDKKKDPKAKANKNMDFDLLNHQEKLGISNHIRKRVEKILPFIQKPSATFSSVRNILLRELISCSIFSPIIELLSDPDTINMLIEDQLIGHIKDQNLPEEISSVLGDQANSNNSTDKSKDVENAAKKATDSIEQLFQIINKTNNNEQLLDLRDEILEQIRKKRILILGQRRDSIVHGELVSDVMSFINQLYLSKKLIDSRIIKNNSNLNSPSKKKNLFSPSSSLNKSKNKQTSKNSFLKTSTYSESNPYTMSKRSSLSNFPQGETASSDLPTFKLYEILNNVNGISAFAEFMDSVGLRFNLEYWLNINGLINSESKSQISSVVINSLWKTYFTRRVDELIANSDLIGDVQKYLKNFRKPDSIELSYLSSTECLKAFQLMTRVQSDIYLNMNKFQYPSFLKTSHYIRFLHAFALSPQSGKIFGNHRDFSLFHDESEYTNKSSKLKLTDFRLNDVIDHKMLSVLNDSNTSFNDLELLGGRDITNSNRNFNNNDNYNSTQNYPKVLSLPTAASTDTDSSHSINYLPRLTLKASKPEVEILNTVNGELCSSKSSSALSFLKSISDISRSENSAKQPITSGDTDFQTFDLTSNSQTIISVSNSGDSQPSGLSIDLPNLNAKNSQIDFTDCQYRPPLVYEDVVGIENLELAIPPGSPYLKDITPFRQNLSDFNYSSVGDKKALLTEFDTKNCYDEKSSIYYENKLTGNLFISNDLLVLNGNLLLLSHKIEILSSLIKISEAKKSTVNERILKDILNVFNNNLVHLKKTKIIYEFFYFRNLVNSKNTKIEISTITEYNSTFSNSETSLPEYEKYLMDKKALIDTSQGQSKSYESLPSSSNTDHNQNRDVFKETGKKKLWSPQMFSDSSSFGSKQLLTKFNINVLKLDPVTSEFKLNWIVTKSYRQICEFHKKLAFVYPDALSDIKFPFFRKSLFGFLKRSKESEKASLEAYFNLILDKNEIIKSDVFKRFMSTPASKISNVNALAGQIGDNSSNVDKSSSSFRVFTDLNYIHNTSLGIDNIKVFDHSAITNEIEEYLDYISRSNKTRIETKLHIESVYEHISSNIINSIRPDANLAASSLKKIYSKEAINSDLSILTNMDISKNASTSNIILSEDLNDDSKSIEHLPEIENISSDLSNKKNPYSFEIFKDVNYSLINGLNKIYPKFILDSNINPSKLLDYAFGGKVPDIEKDKIKILADDITQLKYDSENRYLDPTIKDSATDYENRISFSTSNSDFYSDSDPVDQVSKTSLIPDTSSIHSFKTNGKKNYLGSKKSTSSSVYTLKRMNNIITDESYSSNYNLPRNSSFLSLRRYPNAKKVSKPHSLRAKRSSYFKERSSSSLRKDLKISDKRHYIDPRIILKPLGATKDRRSDNFSNGLLAGKQLENNISLGSALTELFIEVFNLKNRNNWLRRNTLVVLLKIVIGTTIDRKTKELLKYILSPTQVVAYIKMAQDILWPLSNNFHFTVPNNIRSPAIKLDTYNKAKKHLLYYIPLLLGNLVGKKNAYIGTNRVFNLLQVQKFNAHLVMVLFDDIMDQLFPETSTRY